MCPPDCEFISIPHNSNLSAGLMFELLPVDLTYEDYADLSAEYERLIEITQHKGESECFKGCDPLYSTDEACGFEKLPFDNIMGARLYSLPTLTDPNPKSFVRYGLKQGLLYLVDPEDYNLPDSNDYDTRFLGFNPFKYGMIGSTDTHLGTAGAVAENNYKGNTAQGGALSQAEGLPDYAGNNPGGLAVLWADENSRDGLFDAMKRREAYATSGPRITLRFFGMWADPGSPLLDMCGTADFAETGYINGVPMGDDLPSIPVSPDALPTFAVYAHKDEGVPGNPDVLSTQLQKIQIIKGWVDESGPHENVYTINPDSQPHDTGAIVDTNTCETIGTGYDELCRVWQDPDFNPDYPAFYYVRVLENPTCRWTTWLCKDVDPYTTGLFGQKKCKDGYEECCDPEYPQTIQERAWSSPIWYTP